MKSESYKKLKFIIGQISIIAPIFLALLIYIRHGIEMNQAKKEYRRLIEIEEELYGQYEDLLLQKETLSSPSRIEKIAIEKLGFVRPDSISFEREESVHIVSKDHKQNEF